MDLFLLGPVEARRDDGLVALGAPKQRALLAMLALQVGRPVSVDRLLAGLWGEHPPSSAPKMVQQYVSELRRLLDGDGAGILTRGRGYELRLAEGVVDVVCFERLLDADRPREGLALWRGDALADVADEPFAAAEIRRLDALYLRAHEQAVDAELRVGRHHEVIDELETLIAEHPLREPLHGQLMLALYRSGRQADALDAYTRARAALVDQLGIEPTPALRELHTAVLRQDHALDASPSDPQASTPLPFHRGDPRERLQVVPRRVPPPVPPTPTVGRERQLDRLQALLTDPATRLLTVVGPAGVGKTRVALELGRTYAAARPGGVAFVSLATVAASEDVAPAITQALGLPLTPAMTPQEALTLQLSSQRLLLILDNFEHVLEAAPLVADLLAAAPKVTVLATSREALRLRAERTYPLRPLTLTHDDGLGAGEGRERSPAVELFLQVARARDLSFTPTGADLAAIAAVCRRLDGLPLAIELAAGGLGLMTAQALAGRVDKDLDELGPAPRDAPGRQRTLRATLNWSHELLSPHEQAAFAGLGIFKGGCDGPTAQTITATRSETLEALIDKQLVLRTPHPNGQRLGMLETVRAFASESLSARSDSGRISQRHAQHYCELSEDIAVELRCTASATAAARLEPEVDNLRGALTWALEHQARELALRLAVAFDEYLVLRQPLEGERWVEAALASADDRVRARTRGRALHRHAIHLNGHSSWARAEAAAQEGLLLFAQLGEARGRAESLLDLAYVRLGQQRRSEAFAIVEEAVEWGRHGGDEIALADSLAGKANMAPTLAVAVEAAEEAAVLYSRLDNGWQLSLLWISITYRALCHGDHAVAELALRDARRAALSAGSAGELRLPYIDGNEGLLAILRRDYTAAGAAFCDELVRAHQYGYDRLLFEGLGGVGAVVAATGDPATAAQLQGASEAICPERHDEVIAMKLDDLFGQARARLGDRPWDRAYARGSQLTIGSAVELALSAAGPD